MQNNMPDPNKLTPLSIEDFSTFYEAAHGYAPFDWQQRLATEVCRGQWPDYLNLPTSSGKTAAIDVAVFALAFQACQASRTSERLKAPRRIFFVVDRRIIVNEAYRATRRTAELLWDAVTTDTVDESSILWQVASWLRTLTGDPTAPPLDCRELRGGIYRDDAWVRSPLQPTVLTSTVDQVGSRMLFRGYGVSDRSLAIHAAMTTCDSLIILDEAHCSRPFSQTVESIARYRGEDWAREPVATAFGLVQMTATPPNDLGNRKLFALEQEDYQNNPLLEQRHACAKPVRLELDSKAKGSTLPTKLAKTLLKQATSLSEAGCRKIAVVVNRVAIAREVFRLLEAKHGEHAQLMIGRMRPIDREQLTQELQEKFSSGAQQQFEQPRFVVATQCLEVGADLDFDGMVTQCASLDALRQRFGRLNRLGTAERCSGVIVAAAGDVAEEAKLDDEKPLDPVYGNALARTWHWLNGIQSDTQFVDFGIKPLDALIAEKRPDLKQLAAPSPDAPVLMPAHVDMLCQTSPRPTPEPNVADYLHGPDRGIPEVRVCWRADLTMMLPTSRRENTDRTRSWHETVAACPPSSAECLSVPLYVLKKWLRGEPALDHTSDVIGEAVEDDVPDKKSHDAHDRCVLVWKPERKEASTKRENSAVSDRKIVGSRVVSRLDADQRIRNGDTIVIPAQFGGWEEMGHVPNAPTSPKPDAWIQELNANSTVAEIEMKTDEDADDGANTVELSRIDVADEAFSQSRARTVLRIHPRVSAGDVGREIYSALLAHFRNPEASLRLDDVRAIVGQERTEISGTAGEEDSDHGDEAWTGTRLIRLQDSGATITRYPGGAAWISKLHPERAQGLPPLPLASFGDSADDLSKTGRLPLKQHLADVFAQASTIANLVGLSNEHTATVGMAAKLHDLGKADPRFQAMLLNKPVNVAYMQRTLWAKSDRFGGSRLSELPEGFRHEMLSVDLLRKCSLPDQVNRQLLSHVIAAHHGYARPLAPVAIDSECPGFSLDSVGLGYVSTEERSQWTPSYRLDSQIADRFWELNRKFGWWGLAYLESVLRLADWSASSSPGKGNCDSFEFPSAAVSGGSSTSDHVASQKIVLSGMDGSRPLGYLAALGVFRTLGSADGYSAARFAWTRAHGAWRPVIIFGAGERKSDEELMGDLFSLLDSDVEEHPALRVNAPDEAGRREYFQSLLAHASIENRTHADWLSCNESDAADADAISQLQTSRRDYHSIAIRGLLANTTHDHLYRTLFQPWDYSDPIAGVSLHLEPREDRRHAYQWYTPSGDPTRKSSGGMIGANRLALEAWPMFQSLPAKSRDRMTTVGFRGTRVSDTRLAWPIWTPPVSLDSIATILAHRHISDAGKFAEQLSSFGIARVYQCNRILVGKTPNLTTASALMTS